MPVWCCVFRSWVVGARTASDVHVPSGVGHAHLECVSMICVCGCGLLLRSGVCPWKSAHTGLLHMPVGGCALLDVAVCACADLRSCGLPVHVHHRLVHAPVMIYMPLWGCAHHCKVVQDCTCVSHLLCDTRGDLCPCTGLCLCLCGAVQCPRGAVHTHVGLSGPTQACAQFVGLCKPRRSCACLCRVVYAHMGLWQPLWGYVHPGEACDCD